MDAEGSMTKQKLIGVGMHKTGTKSLARALRILGYRVAGPFGVDDPDVEAHAITKALALLQEVDAVQDNPWPLLFRQIDETYPGCQFVLTVRNPDEWIRSVVRHFGGKSTPMRTWIYGIGDPVGHEDRYLDIYNKHNHEVAEYFAGRPDDLLKIDFSNEPEWPELCSFLQQEAPQIAFPHENSSRTRRIDHRVRRKLESWSRGADLSGSRT